jgi:hypothetical protein
MKRMAGAILAVALAAGIAAAGEGGKIQWRDGKQYDASLLEAKTTGQPIILYFTTSW